LALELLEGKTVNLRVWEREDADIIAEFISNVDFRGEYGPVEQESKSYRLKRSFDNPPADWTLSDQKNFIVQKKDGTEIGLICSRLILPYGWRELGLCDIVPSERGKGYGTEATQLIVDYLFLSGDIGRIQTITDVRNKPAQRTLEKAGFQKEGTIRKALFNRGEWRDYNLYGILREEWKEPKILTRTT
jgi:aminoglycoside 6'-N-acetyltransferase